MGGAPIILYDLEHVADRQLTAQTGVGETPSRSQTCLGEAAGRSRTIPFKLDILGHELRLCFAVTTPRVRLPDLVNPARALCTKITRIVLEQLGLSGQPVPCRKGCAACCKYLVPLSVPEALAVVEETSRLPQPRRSILIDACIDSAAKVLAHCRDLPDAESLAAPKGRDKAVSATADWYSALSLTCPFLVDAACTIYPTRPLACREHFVAGSASLCADLLCDDDSVVPMPVSILNTLVELTARLEQSSLETVMLPLAYAWAEQNAHRAARTWLATFVVETFIELLTAQIPSQTETPVACF
jgi:Fe-S-cluster containining protein